jgi:hypothetical protein
MWTRFATSLRRNLVAILLGCLIVTQILMLRGLVSLEETINYWGCGTRTIPCRVVVQPDR